MKQVVLIHGGETFSSYEEYLENLRTAEVRLDGSGGQNKRWNRNLGEALGENFEFAVPTMPCKQNAKYLEWNVWFGRVALLLQKKSTLIGHSLGANFVTKYLAENTVPVQIHQLHLVAGVFGTRGGGFDMPDDLSDVEKQADKIFIYHSKDDPIVLFSHAEKYKRALPKAELVVFEDRGHFLGEEFPELVERVRQD